METDFVIDKVSWHIDTLGNTESREQIYLRFRSIINFLQDNGLTTRIILERDAPIPDNLRISVSDLTDKGFLLIKKYYDKWLKGIDNGKSVYDLRLFSNGLK